MFWCRICLCFVCFVSKQRKTSNPKSLVTTLIIRYTHEQLCHAGRGQVLAKLRERYWIVGANFAVYQLISGGPDELKPGPKIRRWLICQRTELPQHRPSPTQWFILVPTLRKNVARNEQDMVQYFACLVSRAVHIEMTHSLKTDSFSPYCTSPFHRPSQSSARDKE